MSAKRLNPKDMLAARNPLARSVVAPVDIYDQIAEQTGQGTKKTAEKPARKTGSQTKPAKKPAKPADDYVRPYSTYLKKSQVRAIKFRAVEREVKDQQIVQEAIDEYFVRHAN